MPAELRRHWTPEDVRSLIVEWRAWPRYELINGELLVTPAPASPHQAAVALLLVRLTSYCDETGVGVALSSPADIQLAADTIVQPDVFVVPRSQLPVGDAMMTWADVHALLLAVEVLSPSSAHADRVEKRDFYLSHGVAEYWVVDLDVRVVELWYPDRARPVLARDTLTWRPAGATTDLRIELPRFFDEVRDKLRRGPSTTAH